MDHHPKKSNALIITIIAVIILAVAIYYIFKKSDEELGTQNSNSISRVFAPLLGTSKPNDANNPNNNVAPTDLNTGSNNPNTTGNGIPLTTDGQNSGNFGNNGTLNGNGGINGGGVNGSGNIGAGGNTNTVPPAFNPIPSPDPITSFPAIFNPDPVRNVENNPSAGQVVNQNPNMCPNDKLEFTNTENAELSELLRQYYLIAPSLKTEDELSIALDDNIKNTALLGRVEELTNQCQAEKADPNYSGPREIKDNPYYRDANNVNSPYLPEFSVLEQLFDIW